uniref:RNA helicase n=1 Tax=Helianthus annuus TaxID=4232 RepID=A0A251SMD6_HELAN
MPGGDSITTTDTYSAAAEDESKEANVFRNTQAGFEGLKLSSELMKALYEEMKFVRPSKFQSMILPMILTPPYKNLIALAPTCSGKTTCFLLGMFSRVDPTLPAPQALCICPSIELAVQNMEVLLKMGKFTGITSDLFIPADKANYIPVTAQVIIGTPGTINRLITAKKLGTSHLKILVFEEADYLLVEILFACLVVYSLKYGLNNITHPKKLITIFLSEISRIVLCLYTHFQALSFMFKIDEFCPLCFHIGFEGLKLSSELMKALYEEMKFVRPSKFQSMILPMILTPPYKNLIALAPTCSGKTTCFLLGILSRVDPTLPAPQALCICPSIELAVQNMEVLLKMGKFTGITSDLFIPADKANYIPVTAQVIIGTPGTINRLIAAKKLGTSHLKILVFEEADYLLLEGCFKEEAVLMKEVVRWSPKCQVLLFSATLSDTIKAFVSTIVKDLSVQGFRQLLVNKEELSLDSVKQYKVNLPDELSKIMVIKDKIMKLGWQTVIFGGTSKSARRLHEALVKHGYAVTTVEGPLTQDDKDKIIKEFKDGLTQVLISTHLLAPGFDQCQVNLVVNYDLPAIFDDPTELDNEAYLHRVGRAGQFGRKGAVFNLLCGDDDNILMEKIERHFHGVTEVPSDGDFKDALKKAGLM